MQIDYTAKRNLKSGHSADTAYQIDVDLSQSDRVSTTEGNQSIALSGETVTVVHRYQEVYSLTTAIISSSSTPDLDDLREFLDSVKGGETFQLDLSGSSEDYVLDSISNPFTENRVPVGKFRFSFRVRKL